MGAAVLAYLFYPLYKWLVKRIPKPLPSESISALLVVLLILLIVLIPLSFIVSVLAAEAYNGYVALRHFLAQPGLNFQLPPHLAERFNDLAFLKEPLVNIAAQFVLWLQRVVKGLPGAFFGVFITLFSIYYLLKGGKDIYGFLKDFFPL